MRKSELINQAYAQLRISGLTVDPTPEDVSLALSELDQLMYRWHSDGRNVGYHFPPPTTGDELVVSDANDDAGLFGWAIQGVVSSLACQLTDYFDKPIPAALEAKRRAGMTTIRQQTIRIDPQQYPNRMPIGSGNHRFAQLGHFYHPNYRGRNNPTDITVNSNMDMTADFTRDLAEGDTIDTYTITASGGVSIQSDSIDGNVISYRVLAQTDTDGTVKIVVTTTNGLVIQRAICFETRGNTCTATG